MNQLKGYLWAADRQADRGIVNLSSAEIDFALGEHFAVSTVTRLFRDSDMFTG